MTSLSTTTRENDRSDGLSGTVAATVTLAALTAATFAWGAVTPAAHAALTAAICAIGCVGIATMLFRGTQPRLTPGALPLLFFIGLLFFQIVPFGIELTAQMRAATGLSRSGTFSLIPAATLSSGRGFVALFVLFVLGATVFAHARRLRQLPWALLLIAAVLSVYYSIHPFLEYIPQYARDSGVNRHVFGTYLNRNHLGALFVLAILSGIGLFVTRQRTLSHGSPGYTRRQVYIVAMGIIAVAGLILSGSRGAMISLVVGGLLMTILLPRPADHGRRFAPLLGTLALLGILPFALPAEVLDRFLNIGRDVTTDGARIGLWSTALGLFELSPLVGNGLGTFGSLSVLTQPHAVVGHIEHAHSDPLQLLAETGILGVNLLLWSGLLLLLHVSRRCRRTRGDRRTGLAIASLAAVGAISTHALVDFNFHVPALAAWTAVLAGAASGTMATANSLPTKGWLTPRWILPPSMVALGLCAVFAGRESWSYQLQAEGAELLQAERIHPCRGEPASRQAWRHATLEESPRDLVAIHGAASRALERNPFDARAWHALALANIWTLDRDPIRPMRRSIALQPSSERPRRRVDLGIELLLAGRDKAAQRWFHELFHDSAIDGVRMLQRIHAEVGPETDLRPLLPATIKTPLLRYAKVLRRRGALRQREQILDFALDRLPNRDRWTIRDAVTLVGESVRETNDEHGRRLHVEIDLDCPADYEFDSQMMCMNLRGEHAAVEHYFRPARGTTLHIVSVPAHVPPGRYDLAVQAFTNGTRFPISFLTIEKSGFHLTPGRTIAAARILYRSTTTPRTQRPGGGLELATGTRLWRPIRLSRPEGTLVLHSSDETPPRVWFNETELSASNQTGRDHRYRLPDGITDGMLEIRPATEHTTSVFNITLLTTSRR